MEKKILAALVLSALGGVAAAAPAGGDWLVRVRALHLDSANKDSTGVGLSIDNKTFPEIDFSYFFTPNIATELVLTYPQKQEVRAGGARIGELKHLPPTLSLQYHFLPGAAFQPYVGAGINYTRFSSIDLPAPFSIEKNSFGLSLQAGFDVPLTDKLVLNFDVKKVQIRTDVSANGVKAGTFKIDPVLIGVGVGWRF
ncbi:OmpW/AlkL family protein [Methylibium sp.]|uniref:OmpW/AlkL family protein n=1 Tax=Methylibium sp. TaxID=2067992 RepID=UPI003D0DAAC4